MKLGFFAIDFILRNVDINVMIGCAQRVDEERAFADGLNLRICSVPSHLREVTFEKLWVLLFIMHKPLERYTRLYTTRHDVRVLQIVYFEQLLEVSSC